MRLVCAIRHKLVIASWFPVLVWYSQNLLQAYLWKSSSHAPDTYILAPLSSKSALCRSLNSRPLFVSTRFTWVICSACGAAHQNLVKVLNSRTANSPYISRVGKTLGSKNILEIPHLKTRVSHMSYTRWLVQLKLIFQNEIAVYCNIVIAYTTVVLHSIWFFCTPSQNGSNGRITRIYHHIRVYEGAGEWDTPFPLPYVPLSLIGDRLPQHQGHSQSNYSSTLFAQTFSRSRGRMGSCAQQTHNQVLYMSTHYFPSVPSNPYTLLWFAVHYTLASPPSACPTPFSRLCTPWTHILRRSLTTNSIKSHHTQSTNHLRCRSPNYLPSGFTFF